MSVLGIFTVKRLYFHEDRYYTYGGFGDYLAGIRPYFSKTVLVAHVEKKLPAKGCYLIPGGNLEVVHLPPTNGEHQVLLKLPITIAKCISVARRIDVAHVRMPDYTGISGALACKLAKVPYFCQIVDDWQVLAQSIPFMKKGGLGGILKLHLYFYDFWERFFCKNQMVFAQGETAYRKHIVNADAHLVFSSSHHEDDILTPKETFKRPPYKILNVARLNSVKNQILLLRALARLNEHGRDWRLAIVGEGAKRVFLEKEAVKLGVNEWVEMPGMLPHGMDLWSRFDAADVFVLPSRSEGTPKVVLEAMCRGIPVAAAAVSGVPAQLGGGEWGLLFPDNDVEGLVSSLERLREDAELRKSITIKANLFVKKQTVEVTISEMVGKIFEKWPHLNNAK